MGDVGGSLEQDLDVRQSGNVRGVATGAGPTHAQAAVLHKTERGFRKFAVAGQNHPESVAFLAV